MHINLMEDRKKASSRHLSRSESAEMKTLLALLVLQSSFWLGSSDSFCLSTLSRSYCPDLQTFDQFNITSYGGRWYEIGSNGYFKNVEEAGGSCVTADYEVVTNITKVGGGGGIRRSSLNLISSFNKQIGPIATSIVQGISLRAGEVCQQARQICMQTHVHGDLFRGLSLIDGLASKIVPNFSLEGDGLVKAKLQIEDAVGNINDTLESLSGTVSQLQATNSNVSQALGDQGDSVGTLTDLARQGTAGAEEILAALHQISLARLQVAKIAGLLFGIANAEQYLFGENSSITTERAAVKLFKAAALIQTAEEYIHGPLAVIKSTLAGAAQSTAMLSVDFTGATGPTAYLQGQATPTVGNHSGKLVMDAFYNEPLDGPPAMAIPDPSSNNTNLSSSTMPSTWSVSTEGKYWILAAEGNATAGYDAVLVYGCHEHPGGGVMQPLFILSRKPTLAQNVIDKFFNVMEALGISQLCAEPFVFTDQGDWCVYPPLPATTL